MEQVFVSDEVQTCNDVCTSRGLVCEPSFFVQLNRKSAFENLGIKCTQYFVPTETDEEIDYPSHKDGRYVCFVSC